MSDLIDKQALREDVEKIYKYDSQTLVVHYAQLFDDLSSTEPERKKKGKWIDEKINSYTSRTYCSECGSSAPFVYKSDDYYGNHAHGETAKTKFCPNCGADMRGE